MPGDEKFSVRYGVSKEVMCDVAPMAVEELMRQFVRTVSPDWSTVRMEVREDGVFHHWTIVLSGKGATRGER